MNRTKYLIVVFLLFAIISCNSKFDPVDDLQDLCTELQENSNNYTEQDWDDAEKKYEEIDNELQQYEYSDEELKNIGRLKGKCATYFMKSYVKSVKDGIRKFSKEFEGAAEGIMEGFNSEEKNNE